MSRVRGGWGGGRGGGGGVRGGSGMLMPVPLAAVADHGPVATASQAATRAFRPELSTVFKRVTTIYILVEMLSRGVLCAQVNILSMERAFLGSGASAVKHHLVGSDSSKGLAGAWKQLGLTSVSSVCTFLQAGQHLHAVACSWQRLPLLIRG